MTELVSGARIGGRYVLEQRLGLGGMGEVWLAEQLGAGAFRRRVVLKCLAPERRGDARLAAMLADEARLVGLLHHPGIVSALDYLETEEYGPIFVLEFVDGASLRTALRLARKNNALLPEPLAVHIGVQVAHALHAAHTAEGREGEPLHVIHRDVSPDNILLSRSGAVYLGDFGVARSATNTEKTAPGQAKGKRGYMAPEQAMGNKLLGPQADVFALGRVISEAADVAAGPELRRVLEKATADKPRERYDTAAEFAAALIEVCPPPLEPQTELSLWLHSAAPEALVARKTAPGTTPVRSDPPPAGRPSNTSLQRVKTPPPMFAAVPPPKRRMMKIAAAFAALLMLFLPIALIYSARHQGGARRLISAFAQDIASHGDLRVDSRPDQAEVYVDGQLRGVTPLLVELPAGMHAIRVGSTRMEHWRATQVNIRENVEHHLSVDLSE